MMQRCKKGLFRGWRGILLQVWMQVIPESHSKCILGNHCFSCRCVSCNKDRMACKRAESNNSLWGRKHMSCPPYVDKSSRETTSCSCRAVAKMKTQQGLDLYHRITCTCFQAIDSCLLEWIQRKWVLLCWWIFAFGGWQECFLVFNNAWPSNLVLTASATNLDDLRSSSNGPAPFTCVCHLSNLVGSL